MWSLGGALDDVISAHGQCVFNISNFNPFLPKVVLTYSHLERGGARRSLLFWFYLSFFSLLS